MSTIPPHIPTVSSPNRLAAPARPVGALSSFSRFLLAAFFFLIAVAVSHRGSLGLVPPAWNPLVEQAMLLFLLVLGYASFGFVLDHQPHPLSHQGLPIRPGWRSETGLGLAIGWAIVVLCLLPMLLFGSIALQFSVTWQSMGWFVLDLAYFALAALALQVAFRGYPLQRAIAAIGELPAVLILSVLYGIWRAWLLGALSGSTFGSSRASMAVSIAMGLLLSLAYLRTRALWLPWGLYLGWTASRALFFGLPVDGIGSHSPLVQGEAIGPLWLTGGDFGLDGSWFAFIVLLIAMPIVYRATRELSFNHNAPVLEPAGIPVDLDAAARKQHDAATRPEAPEIKPLVQILPAGTLQPMPIVPNHSPDPASDYIPSANSEETH